MTDRFPDILNPVVDSSGNPISGAKLFFYREGTSTKKDTFSDSAKTIANTNPVVADSGGRFGDIFMLTDEQYKVVLAPAADTDPPTSPIDTWDNLSPILQPGTFPVLNVIDKSANFTILTTQRGATFLVDASSGPVTASLPAVATAASGFSVRIKKVDSSANLVTLDGDGSETIDGLTTVALGVENDALTVTGDGTQWNIEAEKRLPTPTAGTADEIVTINSAGTGFTTTTNPLPTGHLTGLTLSNGTDTTNDIDIAAGKARDDADTANLSLPAAVGKQLDVSWAAGGTPGAPTGGLSSSLTLTNDTTYHGFLGLVSGTEEIGFDSDVAGANLVTDHSFTNLRYIGSVNRLTATNQLFVQIGDDVLVAPFLGFQDASPATTAETKTLADVPTGIKVKVKLSASLNDASTGTTIWGLASSLDIADTAPSASAHNYVASLGTSTNLTTSSTFDVWTNTSAQIRTRHSFDPGDSTLDMSVHGWTNRRGRDG